MLVAVIWAGSAPAATGCNALDFLHGGNGTPTLTLVWHNALTAQPAEFWLGRPAVDGGRVFVADFNQIAALDAATGAVIWERPVRHAGPPPSHLLADGGRVFLSDVDSVLAMDAADGHTIWNFHPDSQAVVVPALDATRLFTGQRGVPVVYALNRTDGTLAWRVNLGVGWPYPGFVNGLAVSGDSVYVTIRRFDNPNGYLASGVLVALDRRDGHELWRLEATSKIISPVQAESHGYLDEPLVLGSMVVVNDFNGGAVVGFDRFAPREAWRVRPQGGPSASSVIGGTSVFTVYGIGAATAIDVPTGRLLWRQDVGGGGVGAAVCAGHLFTNDGRIQRLDTGSGRLTGQRLSGSSNEFTSNIATDGRVIYFTGAAGAYAVRCN